MTATDWLKRIRLEEDSTLELKRVVWRGTDKIAEPHPDSLSDELAAMANAGGGTLILGVDDKSREVVGIPQAAIDGVEAWITSICLDRINPPLGIQTRHIELPDEAGTLHPVILVNVPRSLWVHQSANGYFRRIGHSKRTMPPMSWSDCSNSAARRALSASRNKQFLKLLTTMWMVCWLEVS